MEKRKTRAEVIKEHLRKCSYINYGLNIEELRLWETSIKIGQKIGCSKVVKIYYEDELPIVLVKCFGITYKLSDYKLHDYFLEGELA